MPALVGDKDDRKDFALRDRSQPPPRTGKTLHGQFPPPLPPTGARPAAHVANTPLKVLRYQPEGEVPIAPYVAITFSQPMVAVTSQADTVARGVPATLSPTPKGTWRWLGTKTLMFDPDPRFPQATTYTVDVPAGTESASGAVLKKPVHFTFQTPAPVVTAMWPQGGPQKRDPLLFAAFDQRIDPAQVLPTIHLRAAGKSFSVRAATKDEIAKDETIKNLIAAADKAEHQGRYLAFTPTELLPGDENIQVNIGPGTPSAEGPRTTDKAQSYRFRTYGPMKVVEWHCSWGKSCPPGTPFTIRFSNPIDADAFDGITLGVDPDIPGFKTVVSGDWLSIYGHQKGRTTYHVTIPAAIKDTFDQTLGKDKTLTFHVGDANPQLFGGSGLTLVNPSAKKPTYDLHSINIKRLDVEVYRVTPHDWPAFLLFMRKNPRKPVPPPGRRVVNRTIKIEGSPDDMSETRIDLARALGKSGHGHAVVIVKPTTWPDRYKPELDAWVESTDIALDAFVDSTDLKAWATRLADGTPAKNVSLSIWPRAGQTGTSDARGTATLALPAKAGSHAMLVGRRGDDVAFLPENTYWWSDYGGWHRQELGERLGWFVYDDRGMYKPGEEVHLKGWLRGVDYGKGGDVSGLGGRVDTVDYRVIGPRGNDITKGSAPVNSMGGFNAHFKLPTTPNLGAARVVLSASGKMAGSFSHMFQIQEFRRPEYQVSSSVSDGPHEVGQSADVTVSADYYAGGGLAGAPVTWRVHSQPAEFSPPGWEGYTFGIFEPWWSSRYRENLPSNDKFLRGTTDASGKHILHIDFLSEKPPRPMSLVAEARVQDVNRQEWAAQSAILVHPSDDYVGIKQDRYFVQKGDPIDVKLIATDQDGKPAVGRTISVKAVRMDWSFKKGQWKEEEVDPQNCDKTATAKPESCSFETPEGGTYKVTATVVDKRGRPNLSQVLVWVSGGELPPVRNVTQQQVTLVPDGKEYRPGQTAHILVEAPFFPAHGLLSLRRSGLVETRSFEMTGPTTTLDIPVTEAYVPDIYAQVDLVGSAPRTDDHGQVQPDLPRRPAYGVGVIKLPVPPVTRTLKVAVVPRQSKIDPGGSTRVDVAVKGPLGKPVAGAELSVVVVDEAVLALTDYKTPDPLDAFYPERAAGVMDYHLRQYVTLARPDMDTLQAQGAGRGGGGVGNGYGAVMGGAVGDMADDEAPRAAAEAAPATGAFERTRDITTALPAKKGRYDLDRNKEAEAGEEQTGQNKTPIALRKDFGALAVFAPSVRTDASGRASIAVKLPDNLTRYRVMVAAVAGEKTFGSGDANITARMSLMVRPSPPRFLNFGDRFELPVVLQNQTNRAMRVEVAVRATNATFTAGHGRKVTVPANDRVEVRFPAAAEMAGTARFQFAAASGRRADAAELSLPVWTPATTEAFATYGTIDRGAVRQKIAMPSGVVTQFGGLEIATSSTQLQALTDAVLYLVHYPYDCAEQISSRMMAIAALRDVLSAFHARSLPSPKELEKSVARDVEALRALQNPDGGFAFWVRGHESWPFLSIHGGHALIRAKEKGYKVPADMLARNLQYLRTIEQHIPWYYPPDVKRTLIAYSLYVRKRMGDLDTAKARAVIAEAGGVGKLNLEAVGWLYDTMTGDKASASQLKAIRHLLGNRATETAATAHFTTSYGDGNYLLLHSDRRADGIILEALLDDQPRNDLVPKIVRGLLAHRVRGHWQNTDEDAFILLAMDKYFHTYEKVTPDFVSRAWLGDAFAGQHTFKGRQTDRFALDVPMSFLDQTLGKAQGHAEDLILSKQGKGRLYYRIGMTYAPRSLWLPAAEDGFTVVRTYKAVDDPGDVTRRKDGTWLIKAGAKVRVELTMVNPARRYHVALVDKLPAGLEPMNPALAVTGTIPQDPNAQKAYPWWWWTRPWYEHQNMRDERVEAFASLLWEGVHEYSYVARATTPGNFVVPPAKAEEMYFPETFGRTSSDRVIVQ